MNGGPIEQNNICKVSTFCDTEPPMNGSRPCRAFHNAIKLVAKSDMLTPPTPKRRVAHSSTGSGEYTNAGVLPRHPLSAPKAKTLVKTIAVAKSVASRGRDLAMRSKESLLRTRSTSVGTTVSSANAFEKSLVPQRIQ